MMLRNMTFHFLDKDMMRKDLTPMITPKLEYTKAIWSPHKKKHVLKIERIQRIALRWCPNWKTYEEISKEIQLTILEKRKERGNLITIYKLDEQHRGIW